MERLNDRIRSLRDRRGISQGALARAVGVSRPAVSKWENGDVENLKLANILKLCHVFSISADELLAGEVAASGATSLKAREPTASYPSSPVESCIPTHLLAAYADLDDAERRLVDAQMEIAIETAIRLRDSRPESQQNAA